MPHIVSTLTNSQQITDWNKPETASAKIGAPAVKRRSVLIKGTIGATAEKGIISNSAVTKITDEELEFLKEQPAFQLFEKRGHFKIVATERAVEKVIKNMPKDDGEVKGEFGEQSSGSAPLSVTDGDFEEGGRAAGAAPGEQKIV